MNGRNWLASALPTTFDWGELLLDWLGEEAERLDGLSTGRLGEPDWQQRSEGARSRLKQDLGLSRLEERRDPPSRTVGEFVLDGIRVEQVVFEPRPGFEAPGLLFHPEAPAEPAPAVLYSEGHWMRHGKAEPHIQAACLALAKLGFVAFVFDPIGQGERGPSFRNHGRKELIPLGISQEGLMVWEHVRAIDFLAHRADVDSTRIGMTGASGGGLSTLYTAAIDLRVSVAVPVCYVTTFSLLLRALRGLNWNNQGDLCNQVPNIVKTLGMAGICALIAPRPLLVISAQRDPQFPVSGAEEVVRAIEPLYEERNPGGIRLRVVDSDHGYDQEMREAAYGWFGGWLHGRPTCEPAPEPPTEPLPLADPRLRCLAGPSSDGDSAFKAIATEALTLSRASREESAVPDLEDLLGIDDSRPRVASVVAAVPGEDHEQLLIETEQGMKLPLAILTTLPDGDSVRLVVPDEVTGDVRFYRALAGRESLGRVAVLQPRALGMTAPTPPPMMTLATVDGTLEDFEPAEDEHLEFEVATNSLMIGRSLLGQQIIDIACAIDVLSAASPIRTLELEGRGALSSVAALIAAAIDRRVDRVKVDTLLTSFEELVTNLDSDLPLALYVPGMLDVADISDIVALLASRTLAVGQFVDGQGLPVATPASFTSLSELFTKAGGNLTVAAWD